MTTPQLHYAVRCYNEDGLYGHYTEAGYFDKLCTAFQNLIEVNEGEREAVLDSDVNLDLL